MGKNKLDVSYDLVKKELKGRGVSLTKDDYFNKVAELGGDSITKGIILKLSPDEYLINEKLKKDPNFKNKVMEIFKESND